MGHWSQRAFVYHIYPLGLCDAPKRNNYYAPVEYRLDYIYQWIDHIADLGVNVVYIGPLFESLTHGYDTTDYYHVDRRLGDRQSLARLIRAFHQRGIRVIVDAVFNHVGRDFWAFKDVMKNQQYSWYCDWFQGLTFNKRSPVGDSFNYKTWKKHYSLVKLNLKNPYVKEHLFKAVEMWINELGVDGLRLDAADCLTVAFIQDLKKFTKKIKPDFWLMGEIVHGDYRKKISNKRLDSITNYQCHRELFQSFNKNNLLEIAHAINNKFGEHGVYKHLNLFNFLDNHDINRIATQLKDPAHLYPLHILLFTMPGIPSVYYGSEFGITGKRNRYNDDNLRPYLRLDQLYKKSKNRDLVSVIKKMAEIKTNSSALCYGEYRELFFGAEQFAFARISQHEYIIIMINCSSYTSSMELSIPYVQNAYVVDLLNNNEVFMIHDHKLRVNNLWANWGRVLKVILQ